MSSNSPKTIQARFVDYSRPDGLRRGYHCSHCGALYRTGLVGFESGEDIICEPQTTKCLQCNNTLYVPFLWNSFKEAEAFAKSLPGKKTPLTLAPIEKFEICYVDMTSYLRHFH